MSLDLFAFVVMPAIAGGGYPIIVLTDPTRRAPAEDARSTTRAPARP